MTTYRVTPRPWVGVVAFLAYLAVFYGVWILNGIDYTHIGDNADTLLKWYVAPLASGAVLLVVLVSVFGWWRPAMFDDGLPRLPRWVLVLPGLLALAAVVNLLIADLSMVTGTMWLYLVVGSILVGFNEEMATRGQLVVALRSRFGELGVWFFSSLLFALLHLPNTVFGTGVFGLIQVPMTFLAGTVFYLLRRTTGTLIAAMALHALWDFSTFAATASGNGLTSIAQPLVGVAGLIVAILLLRRESRGTKVGAVHGVGV